MIDDDIPTAYNFSDFTTNHYQVILELAKSKFDFLFFDEIHDRQSYILWRHDVDFSIQRAVKLAKIERETGVKSTYFIHLHNEYYNLFEKDISDLIYRIKDLGHQIGLHFDTHYYDIRTEDALEEKLALEKEIIDKVFGIKPTVFSFHNTTAFTLSCQKWEYCGLINAYASFFKENVEYCSDSNGYWKFDRLLNLLENTQSRRLQILTHPEWWQEEIMSPWERIQCCIDGRSKRNKEFYRQHLRKFGMKNIDWNGEVE